jgi:hypothetical protein
MQNPSTEDAQKAFIAFVDAMHAWETRHYDIIMPLMEEGEAAMDEMEQAKLELAQLFEEHLEPGHGDRRRLDAIGLNDPATYDSKRDDIAVESSKPSEVVLAYQQNAEPESKFRFTVKHVNGKWLVHKGEIFDDERNKWLKLTI